MTLALSLFCPSDLTNISGTEMAWMLNNGSWRKNIKPYGKNTAYDVITGLLFSYKYSSDNMAGTRMPFAFINPILKGENKILAQVQLNIYRSCLRGTFLIASASLFGGAQIKPNSKY